MNELKLTLRMKSVMLSGLDSRTFEDGTGSRTVIGGRHTINALMRRGLVVERTVEARGMRFRPSVHLSAYGRTIAKMIQEEYSR